VDFAEECACLAQWNNRTPGKPNDGAMNLSEENLQKEIRSIIAETLEIEENSIGMEDHFIDDLGIDSITALDIVAGIENKS